VQAGVDESREITVQFIATNNAGMPWEFRPSQTA
jgi:cytochrome c oxidase assembly protein subunit 11